MRLARVEYEFFDFEQPSDAARELARQIRLEFADAPTLFLSWTWERQHDSNSEPYSIGRSANSFFQDEPAAVVDASMSPLWSRHIGSDVEVSHCPSTSPKFAHQVIEVRSRTRATFVFSLGVDRVTVSSASPIPVD
jgi:hypothetical protein